VLGEPVPVRAQVARIAGFSAHADRDELLRWASVLKRSPKRAFVVHGEPAVAEGFARTLAERTGWPTAVPGAGETVALD
jgi:metallo-beta-lactamase family protein